MKPVLHIQLKNTTDNQPNSSHVSQPQLPHLQAVGTEEAVEEELPELVPVTPDTPSPQPCGLDIWDLEDKLLFESLSRGMCSDSELPDANSYMFIRKWTQGHEMCLSQLFPSNTLVSPSS